MDGKKSNEKSSQLRKHPVSCSRRAELQLPVSRMERYLRENSYAPHLPFSTPVFLEGVLEYLTASILDLARKEARGKRKKHILPQHLETAAENNQQLGLRFGDSRKSMLDEMTQNKKK
ncbi:histone H2A-beta, sperm-like [Cavia porcellus]|uniref:Histone H2A n=1 Tax=Cavia porcellus TaxID=10141 RepID=H0WAH4_CAVPO|nr:histone H2A-beta, sperm-like [Cavia porcellus]